eukprot:jgi/Botrbrau1/5579/Bobra.97_2s0010.1
MVLQDFLEVHSAQLHRSNVPEGLQHILYEKLLKQQFDAGESFAFQYTPEHEPSYSVTTCNELAPEEDIWLVDHAVTVPNIEDLPQILEVQPDLLLRLASMLELDQTSGSHGLMQRDVTANIHLIMYEMSLQAPGSAVQELIRLRYVMDEFGTRIRFARAKEDANVRLVPFVYIHDGQMETYSLLWVTREIAEGQEALREVQVGIHNFQSQSYWERRHASQPRFEWYMGSDFILQALERHCTVEPSAARVLHPGCGTSLLGRDINSAGYKEVVNVDYVQAVADQMNADYAAPGLTWEACDLTQTTHWLPASFDLVVDKAMLDTFLSKQGQEGPGWVAPAEGNGRSQLYLREMARILRPGGNLVIITLKSEDGLREVLGGVRAPERAQNPRAPTRASPTGSTDVCDAAQRPSSLQKNSRLHLSVPHEDNSTSADISDLHDIHTAFVGSTDIIEEHGGASETGPWRMVASEVSSIPDPLGGDDMCCHMYVLERT